MTVTVHPCALNGRTEPRVYRGVSAFECHARRFVMFYNGAEMSMSIDCGEKADIDTTEESCTA